eukprot:CAMPEP_0174298906 /NCGR_PEP_ID=MMETSP0809-20121228/55140_1 /TAXON_ID=73025 ORGANISM="Eutreptiella gymnastica-like, Strain CCMP1594" /NCGR_SAMPLE_ID=MMETSP0809 /ASSEMBLY_ACC=CAM_ASM_000658 /LENGTH=229 /DNA_ID=CAMNT_0015403701 /DNA_START=89 /DNA_END=778 /DNA_ORIENTATION=+
MALSLTGTLGFLDPMYFILDFDLAFRRLQVWRLVTSLFFFGMFAGPQTFAVLINIYLFTMYSGRLEEGDFKGKRAHYIWMFVLSGAILLFVGGFLMGSAVLARGLLLVVVWVWCRRNAEQRMNIMGIFEVSALQFPWVLTLMHWLFGQGWIPDVIGIVAGHFYIYMRDILPKTHGLDWLQTPQLLLDYLPDQRVIGGFSGGGFMPASRQEPTTAPKTKSWGKGRVLGSD